MLDGHALGGQRSDEEQGRDVLAADGAGKPGPAALEPALDGDRRAAVAASRGGLHPQLFQGLQEIVQGPLAEAVAAGEDVSALPQSRKRRQKAHGGAGVTQVNGLRHRPPVAADALDPDVIALPVKARPQLGQGLGGDLGVFSPEGVAQHAFPRGESRGHQGPVGVTLRAGQSEGGVDRLCG